MNSRDEQILKKAIALQKMDKDLESLSIFRKLLKDNPNNSKVISFLGLLLAKVSDYEKAIPYLEKAVKLKPNNELLSLALYISYSKQENYELAFKVIFEYLDKKPAKLFKDTLVELLKGLIEGYGTSHKDEIIRYARSNHISIPQELR